MRKSAPKARIIYIGDRGGKFSNIAVDSGVFDETHTIFAGKLRRYHGESLLTKMLDIRTLFFNLRDLIYVCIGIVQSILLLQKFHARSALLKGGFVCVPVAIAAKFHKVPTVTHDSDAVPGLSNKFAAKYATIHAVGMPAENYNYPRDNTRFVGVPIEDRYTKHLNDEKTLKEKYKIKHANPVLLITGGSQGSRRVNSSFIGVLPGLIEQFPRIHVFHHVGSGNKDQYDGIRDDIVNKHVTVFDFSDKLYEMSFLSDIVVARGGATTLAEFSAQSKACIIIPHPELAGDHQTKNSQIFKNAGAAIVLSEKTIDENQEVLFNTIVGLLEHDTARNNLEKKIHSLMPSTPAAKSLSDIMLKVSEAGN